MVTEPFHLSLVQTDAQLLADCEVHTYRASGPGGQKRNKIESAVRLRHLPTAVTAVATESRSQHDNRRVALRRLREAIAVRVRTPVDLAHWVPPAPFLSAVQAGGRIRLRDDNPNYPIVVATILNVLAASNGRVSDAARFLNLSTHHLTQFLSEHPPIWQEVNRLRAQFGLTPLRG
jgi:hypothetical protein